MLGSTVDNCTKLTSVNIPKGVTFLVNGFAISCTALKSITIPEGITGIGAGAFAFSGLTSVNLPSTLIDLDSNIFLGCPTLSSVTFSPNSQLTAINSACFKDCPLITTITIPSQVKTIGYEAFRGCTGLTSITNEAVVPQTLTEEVFTGVNVANIKLNVPAGKVTAYKTDPIWGSLDVQGKDATGILNNVVSTVKLSVANGVMQVSNVDLMASVELYSATGAKIASAINTECATFNNLPQGIVMVKVTTQGGTSDVMKAMIR